MNILDKLSIAAIGITITAVTYDDISEAFSGLFEASASIADMEINPWKKKIRHETLYCENEDNNTCVDLLAIGFAALDKKPELPLGRIPSMKQVDCLAQNIYQEAGIESLEGKIAVAFGTLQRVKEKGYHNTICGVVWAKGWSKENKKWVSQMSWTLNKRKINQPTPPIYRTIALDVLSGKYKHPDPTCPFTNWHNPIDVDNSFNEKKWKKGETSCTRTIGRHTYIALK